MNELERGRWRMCSGVLLALGAWASLACSAEPCAHSKDVPVDAQTSPLPGGASIFSQCANCPILPQLPGVDDSGPATLCDVSFTDSGSEARVGCFYGPGGRTSSSIANGADIHVPNRFGYCEAHCPEGDALHVCRFIADENGVQAFSCHYGQTCG